MIVGTLKEVKNNENRVALTPAKAKLLVNQNHQIVIEKMQAKALGTVMKIIYLSDAKSLMTQNLFLTIPS